MFIRTCAYIVETYTHKTEQKQIHIIRQCVIILISVRSNHSIKCFIWTNLVLRGHIHLK